MVYVLASAGRSLFQQILQCGIHIDLAACLLSRSIIVLRRTFFTEHPNFARSDGNL